MKSFAINVAVGLVVVLTAQTASADNVYFEDFEDSILAGPGYVVSPPDDLDELATEDYWGRIDMANLPADYSYNGHQGTGFYGASDTDSVNGGTGPSLITMDIMGIDISNYENLQFSLFFAEDDDGTNQDWDQTTSVRVLRQIDGGGYFHMIGVESSDNSGGNKEPAIDLDGDGFGEGTKITDTFTQFFMNIANGSLLDIKIEIEDLDTGDEDIAFDNLLLTGDFTGIPEPSAVGLLALLGSSLFMRRRR